MEQSVDSQKNIQANSTAKIGASLPSTSSPPSFDPHSLGREFVRQYYTVLNKGPHILHRSVLTVLKPKIIFISSDEVIYALMFSEIRFNCLELSDPEVLDEKYA